MGPRANLCDCDSTTVSAPATTSQLLIALQRRCEPVFGFLLFDRFLERYAAGLAQLLTAGGAIAIKAEAAVATRPGHDLPVHLAVDAHERLAFILYSKRPGGDHVALWLVR